MKMKTCKEIHEFACPKPGHVYLDKCPYEIPITRDRTGICQAYKDKILGE